ncbi:MAG TPA: bifunctional (p)ppGpp synthetase/guanosine-3',5'-bis(diphosphate) 3'-pyrophosphohydrolase [Candidatus Kryptonia bacterium]
MSYLADVKSVEKLNRLLEVCRANLFTVDENLIRRAFEFSWNAHVRGKPRASGEPFFSHPYEVALVVAKEIPLDDISVAAALLHDVVEDTAYDLKAVRSDFGDEIAEIVDGVTKISGAVESHDITRAENYRKMLLSMAKDLRVILVKFADRLHNMRTLAFLAPEKQQRIAKETLEIYAPLAHRFGLAKVKWEFEDLAFKHINAADYEYISRKLNAKRREREAYIRKFIQPIRKRLEGEEIKFDITGRPKHIYSIYNKMVKRGKPIEEIYDLFAVRVILDTADKNECFSVYGIVSEIYTPVPERFKDYISVPKQNGYQSIHTTVVGPEGKMVEVQIRTNQMDEVAERGVAAHWKYKEDIKLSDKNLDEWISWVREILEQPPVAASEDAATSFLESFKLDLYQDEIYVFTPKGDLQILPRGSTPVDFAFEIHSEVGTHCVGAKVNGRIVPLNTKLNSGDQIEIITSSNQNVNPDWEKFVVSRKAKAHIRRWLNDEARKKAAEGEEIWTKRVKKHKLTIAEDDFAKVLHDLKFDNTQKFFIAIADEEIEPDSVIARLTQQKTAREPVENTKPLHTFVEIARRASDGIVVDGTRTDLKFSYAKCCSPIPGDDIVGFVTTGEGIKIHRRNCTNLARLENAARERIVDATWPGESSGLFVAGVTVSGLDRPGILTELTHAVTNYQNTNIRSVSAEVRGELFECHIIIYVKDKEHLERLIDKLKKIDSVTHVDRMSAGSSGQGPNA